MHNNRNTIAKENIMNAVLYGTLTDVKSTFKKHNLALVQDKSYFDYELLKVALNRKEYISHPITKFLIRQGCRVRNPNEQRDRTPLHIAISLINTDIIEELLARGASICEKNKKNETVLFAAFRKARHSVTDILLNHCGMKDLDPADEDDVVHFYIACVRGHLNAIRQYLSNGFDIDSPLHLDFSKYNGVGPESYEHKKTCLDLPDNKSHYRMRTEDSDSSDTERDSYDSSDSDWDDDPSWFYTRIRMICTVYPSHNPLHFAIKYAFEEVVELLLTHGADCNKKDKDGKTPLHWACEISKCKKTDIIEMLLEHKACTTVQDNNGKTAIHIAFYNRNREKEKIFDTLLAKVEWGLTNCTDYDGLSHFHIACTRSNISAINDFLNSGVPIDNRVDSGFYKAFTALHFAILHNQKEVVALLLKRNADVNFKIYEDVTSLHIACAYEGEKFSELEYNYDNPMNESWTSNRSDQFDIIKLLINHGADLDAKDCCGNSPIYHACKFYGDCSSDFFKNFLVIEISIRMEEIIKIFLSKKDHGNAHKINPSSVLHILSENKFLNVSEKLIEFLITEGADLCAFDDHGLTPLHIAAKSFNTYLVLIFLKHNVNVNIKSENSLIPLQLAIDKFRQYLLECREIVCMLLENGSDVNIINENGKTILQDAIESNKHFVVEKLLNYGADINLVKYLPIISLSNLELLRIVFIHVQKLVTVGLPVNDSIEKYFNRLHEYDNDLPISFNNWDNYFNCMKELKRMKLEKVDNYTSLYSILRKDQHDLSKHVKNNSLIKIIMDQNIEEKYPLYGYLLKIQFKKGIVRRDVLKSATSSLKRVIKFNLPDSCCDFVLKHLTNEEITNLKSA